MRNQNSWYDANYVFARNTDEEIRRELYVDGPTAMYTKRIQEINAAIKAEDEARRARKLALRATRATAEATAAAEQNEVEREM